MCLLKACGLLYLFFHFKDAYFVQWSQVDIGSRTSTLHTKEGTLLIIWSRIVAVNGVILVGSVICFVKLFDSTKSSRMWPSRVWGSALKSPVRNIFEGSPPECRKNWKPDFAGDSKTSYDILALYHKGILTKESQSQNVVTIYTTLWHSTIIAFWLRKVRARMS